MTYVFKGVVHGDVVVLDGNVRLPDGVDVEVRVQEPQVVETACPDRDAVYAALMKRRAAYAGQKVGMSKILEEEKQDREERVDEWLAREP
jgi:hypothetical protein